MKPAPGSTFWSHTFTDWEQIESPSPQGEVSIHGLNLDWKRFNTAQVCDFCAEIKPLKAENAALPTTTNFMGTSTTMTTGNWPRSSTSSPGTAIRCGTTPPMIAPWAPIPPCIHDLMRTLKGGKPFFLMESSPSLTNWQPISKLKKPGMHILSSLQAVAHGSDSVQYFQWRKSRGSVEKFHGAVVDHVGHINTRVGREVEALGRRP